MLSPALAVGDVLLYHDIRRAAEPPVSFDVPLTELIAARLLPQAQSGIRGFASDVIVTHPTEKRKLHAQYGADAVDMESLALAVPLQQAGVKLAAVRIGSDAVDDELPDLDRAVDACGAIDPRRLVFALARRPRASIALVRHAARALRTLERAVFEIVRAA